MTEATVHRIRWDLNRFQAFLWDMPEIPPDLFQFNGRPRADSWIPYPIYSDRPRLERPDIWRLVGVAGFVVDEETAGILEPYLTRAGELLPVTETRSGEQMSLLNILEDVDCVDPRAYLLDALEFYPHFLEHRLPESGLFKIPQVDSVDVFHLERDDEPDSFRRRVEANDLKGVVFQRVWSSGTGPEDVNLMKS